MGEVPSELTLRSVSSTSSLGESTPPRPRPFDVFIETTTQMLATPRLQERLLLALEAIVHSFGFQQAAVAIVNEREAELRIRAGIGFQQDPTKIEMPLDSSAACVRVIHDAQPFWIDLDEDESSRHLFGNLDWRHEVLALPLFGISELPSKPGRESVGPRLAGQYWTFERGSRVGVLYAAADRDTLDQDSYDLLRRFAERIGIVASLATHQERLVTTVTKLQRERQWIESIMKSVADPIVLTDLDNEILLQNRRAEELFSGSANAGEGKRRALKMNDLLFSAYLSSATVSSSEVIQRDITLVDPIEGSDIHFEVISTPVTNGRGEPGSSFSWKSSSARRLNKMKLPAESHTTIGWPTFSMIRSRRSRSRRDSASACCSLMKFRASSSFASRRSVTSRKIETRPSGSPRPLVAGVEITSK